MPHSSLPFCAMLFSFYTRRDGETFTTFPIAGSGNRMTSAGNLALEQRGSQTLRVQKAGAECVTSRNLRSGLRLSRWFG